MLSWRHGKDTNNHSIRGAGSQSDSRHQSILWSLLRQRCDPTRLTGSGAGHFTAVHSTQAPNKEEPFIPALERLSFTHILQTDFVKEPGKTIAIVEIDITSALAIPLSSDFPKMWVKVSLRKSGAFWLVDCKRSIIDPAAYRSFTL